MIRHWTILFGMALGLAAPLTLSQTAHAGEDVTLEQVPDPVRETIQREVKDARIIELEKETDDGRTVYEVEYVPQEGPRKVELKIAPDGTILKRKEKF